MFPAADQLLRVFILAGHSKLALLEVKRNDVAVEATPFWDDGRDAIQQRLERASDNLDREFKRVPKLTQEKQAALDKALGVEFKAGGADAALRGGCRMGMTTTSVRPR